MMLWFMPAFMTIIFLNFASGLNLYYTAQNFASFPQQLQLNRERRDYMASRGIKAPAVTAPSRPPKPKPKT
jgi:membrane protein insertase Oxa1/YidC/SpoIIIJ